MNRDTVLRILLELEEYRIKVENNSIKSNMDDYTTRINQAQIASLAGLGSRKMWVNILKKEYGLVY